VENATEEVDDLYPKAMALLGNISVPEFTAGQVVLTAESMDAIDNVAGKCQDVCDQARAIAVSFATQSTW